MRTRFLCALAAVGAATSVAGATGAGGSTPRPPSATASTAGQTQPMVPLPAVSLAPDPPTADTVPSPAVTPSIGTSNVASGPPAVGPHGRLIFDDEFSGAELDRSTWDIAYPWGSRFNAAQNEDECYVGSALTVQDGVLTITARRHRQMCDGQPKSWRSGLVQARRSVTFTYGYIEMRAKLPGAAGMWPALWMLPADLTWPPEIDIAESFGRHVSATGDLTKVSLGLHYGHNDYRGASVQGPDYSSSWHTFAVDWRPRSLRWYVDGTKVFAISGSEVPSAPEYPLMDLAVATQGVRASTPATSSMSVDYVRIWQPVVDLPSTSRGGDESATAPQPATSDQS